MTAHDKRARWKANSPLKATNNQGYVSGETVKRVNHIPRFAYRYRCGEAGLEIHVRVRPGFDYGDSKYYIARLRRFLRRKAVAIDSPGVVYRGHAIVECVQRRNEDPSVKRKDVCQLDRPVFIDVIEPVKSGEPLQWMKNSGGSFLRGHVERLEVFELSGISATHVFPATAVSPVLFPDDDGKLDLINGLSVRRCAAMIMPNRQQPRKMIEGATKVVRGISHDKTPLIRDIYDSLNSKYNRTLFSLILSGSDRQPFAIRTSFGDLGTKRVDVFFSAFELKPGPR